MCYRCHYLLSPFFLLLVLFWVTPLYGECVFLEAQERPGGEGLPAPLLLLEARRFLEEQGYGVATSLEFPFLEKVPETSLTNLGFTHLGIVEGEWEGTRDRAAPVRVQLTLQSLSSQEVRTGSGRYSPSLLWETPLPLGEKVYRAFQELKASLPPPQTPTPGLCFRIALLPREVSTGDRDHDGIPDDQDRCPEQPEDRNGYQDEDGCPENLPIQEFSVQNPQEQPLDSIMAVMDRGIFLRSTEGKFLVPLPPGEYRIYFTARGYQTRFFRIRSPTPPLKVILSPAPQAAPPPPPEKEVVSKKKEPRKRSEEKNAKERVLSQCKEAEDRSCITALKEYLEQNPDPELSSYLSQVEKNLRTTVNELYEMGLRAFRQENIDEALEFWGQALNLNPEDERVRSAYEKARTIKERLKSQ